MPEKKWPDQVALVKPFETDIGEEFGGFYARDVELVDELIQANSIEKVPTKLMSPTSKTVTLTAALTITL